MGIRQVKRQNKQTKSPKPLHCFYLDLMIFKTINSPQIAISLWLISIILKILILTIFISVLADFMELKVFRIHCSDTHNDITPSQMVPSLRWELGGIAKCAEVMQCCFSVGIKLFFLIIHISFYSCLLSSDIVVLPSRGGIYFYSPLMVFVSHDIFGPSVMWKKWVC